MYFAIVTHSFVTEMRIPSVMEQEDEGKIRLGTVWEVSRFYQCKEQS